MNKRISLDLNFVAMATQTRIISLCSKQRLLFSHNKKSVSPIFLQNLTLPAVTIKLYCFKLLYEDHFCLNNRPFVFSVIENNFDFGCHSNEI